MIGMCRLETAELPEPANDRPLIRVRRYAGRDAQTVLELAGAAGADTSDAARAMMRELCPVRRGAGGIWVAHATGFVVGCVALVQVGERQGAIRHLHVRPTFHGDARTAQRMLLLAALRRAAQEGLSRVWTSTALEHADAVRFCAEHGFVQVAASAVPAGLPQEGVCFVRQMRTAMLAR